MYSASSENRKRIEDYERIRPSYQREGSNAAK